MTDYQWMQIISQVLTLIFIAIIVVGVVVRLFRDYLSKTVTARAKVLDKYATSRKSVSNVKSTTRNN